MPWIVKSFRNAFAFDVEEGGDEHVLAHTDGRETTFRYCRDDDDEERGIEHPDFATWHAKAVALAAAMSEADEIASIPGFEARYPTGFDVVPGTWRVLGDLRVSNLGRYKGEQWEEGHWKVILVGPLGDTEILKSGEWRRVLDRWGDPGFEEIRGEILAAMRLGWNLAKERNRAGLSGDHFHA